jgi:hypothetical protein
MFDGKFNYETKFYAGGYDLSGIESVDLSYQHSYNIAKHLGNGKASKTISGPVAQKVSLTRYLLYSDPILAYTGDIPLNGNIEYDSKSYRFNSGYLSDYSVNCAVGAVPRVAANFEILGQMTTGLTLSGDNSNSHPSIEIPTQGSISVTCDNSTTNRIVGFDYSLKVNRKLFYTIGSKTPVDIQALGPIEYSASVQIDVDDAFLKNSFSFFTQREQSLVVFSIVGRNNTPLQGLSIPNASLVGEQLQASSDGGVKLTLNYIGHS